MDYEKKYKEALERMKIWVSEDTPDEFFDTHEVHTFVFPEIAESGDEKIRKALCAFVNDSNGDSLWIDYDVHKEDALAYLEKQGEQKPVEWSEEDKSMALTLMRDIEQVSFISKEGKNKRIKWLNNLTDRVLLQPKQGRSVKNEI